MFYLVVVVSVLLSLDPAQSRYIENSVQRFFDKTANTTKHDNVPGIIDIEANKHPGLDEPLILFGDVAVHKDFRNADPCTARGCKWERSHDGLVYVPYYIANHYSRSEIDVIKLGMQSFASFSCIRFIPHQGERFFIHIKSLSGCYSYIGRQRGEQVVSLQRYGCIYTKIVQHELLHALGFHHEQNRSDRDRYIKILYQNIIPAQTHNFNKANTNNLYTPYDYNSVMHYDRYAFSRNRMPTMVPIPNNNARIGMAEKMSSNDILRLNRLYCS